MGCARIYGASEGFRGSGEGLRRHVTCANSLKPSHFSAVLPQPSALLEGSIRTVRAARQKSILAIHEAQLPSAHELWV